MKDKPILVSLSQVSTASLGETGARSASPLLLPGHRARLEKNQVYKVFVGWVHPLQIHCRPTEQAGFAG